MQVTKEFIRTLDAAKEAHFSANDGAGKLLINIEVYNKALKRSFVDASEFELPALVEDAGNLVEGVSVQAAADLMNTDSALEILAEVLKEKDELSLVWERNGHMPGLPSTHTIQTLTARIERNRPGKGSDKRQINVPLLSKIYSSKSTSRRMINTVEQQQEQAAPAEQEAVTA